MRRDPNHDSHPVQPSDVYDPSELPAKVDLRKHMPPVFDQGQVGSCTANALAGAYGYLEGRVAPHFVNVSRLFIYWGERNVEGTVDKDAGACICDGVKILQKNGAPREETWPYDPKRVEEKPSDSAFEEGKGHELDQAATVAVDLHAMKHCLAEGYPFVFGILLDGPTFTPDAKGFISRPTKTDGLEGHAMCCVGYDDAKKVFIVRNSWGTSWGDKGYCYLPYDWMTDKNAVHDVWTLRRGHGLDFSQVGQDSAGADDDDEEEDDEEGDDEEGDDEGDDEEGEDGDEDGDDEEGEDGDEDGDDEEGEDGDDEDGDDEEGEDGDDEDGDDEDGEEEQEGA